MNVLYHMPSLKPINAGYTIYYGYKHAFEELGHKFIPLTAGDDIKTLYGSFNPDIFITSLNYYNLKFLNLDELKKLKKKGLKVFVNTPFWQSPLSKLRISEQSGLKDNKKYISLIKSGDLGDVYYNICEQNDERMEGFEKNTGYKHHTILLAADKTIPSQPFSRYLKADISFIGTYLPQKRNFIKEYVFPLRKRYNLKLYGKDWSFYDRAKNFVYKTGQFYNISFLRGLAGHELTIEQERQIYKSSLISINIHEDYQKQYKGDINERTFKIPASDGFEITDNVPSLTKYFKDNIELVIAKNKDDWFDKINYYIKYPEKRLNIIKAGKKKILEKHTYHNRVAQIILLYKNIK